MEASKMSTRCQIAIYEKAEMSDPNKHKPQALVYRHHDGYPDGGGGVVATVLPFIKKFAEKRGLDDLEYLAARLIQNLCKTVDDEGSTFLGVGACFDREWHGDIAYVYTICIETGEFKVWKCTGDDGDRFALVETHPIK
jgi:hypothetical protein